MGKRRAHGEGTIVRRRDGRWAGALVVGRTPSGKVIRKWTYGRTRQQVVAALERLRQQRRITGLPPAPERTTLEQYLRGWLADTAAPTVRPKTLDLYSRAVGRIVRILGRVRLADLGPHHVQHLLRTLEQEGAGVRTRQVVYETLRKALNDAVRLGLRESNPAIRVRPPRKPYQPPRTWTAEEARRFLRVAREDRYWGVFALALTTGLRKSEVLGLCWDSVDLEKGVVRVVRQLQDLHGALVLSEPKSAASRRSVPLPPLALEALRWHHAKAVEEGHYRPNGPVFMDTRGGFVRPSNLHRRHFLPLIERAGVPRIRFHDLRHTAAKIGRAHV